jgi:hypothetical protein
MRRRSPPELTGPAAELAAHAAAMRADPAAGERLAAAESWVTMLADSGNDPEIAGLLLTFAREPA